MNLVLRISAAAGATLALPMNSWAADCRNLQEQRDQLASQAIQAEVRLLHRERQRICPQQESLASAEGSEASVNLDFSRYIRCRQEAEAQLRQHHPVLYTNRHGFTHYTSDGARWARQADALLQSLKLQGCLSAPNNPSAPALPHE